MAWSASSPHAGGGLSFTSKTRDTPVRELMVLIITPPNRWISPRIRLHPGQLWPAEACISPNYFMFPAEPICSRPRKTSTDKRRINIWSFDRLLCTSSRMRHAPRQPRH